MIEDSVVNAAAATAGDRELIRTTWRMLDAIHRGDAAAYAELCDPGLTCYEDLAPYRVDGVEFHLDLIRSHQAMAPAPLRFDMLQPRVQRHGSTAVVTCTRLVTWVDPAVRTAAFNETRVFVRAGRTWRMIHFHRSPGGA